MPTTADDRRILTVCGTLLLVGVVLLRAGKALR